MDDETTRKQLAIAFEYCYAHDDWVTPLDEALEGLTPAVALYRLGPDSPSIWQIILHVAAWNRDIVIRTETQARHHPEKGAWPPLPEIQNEESWNWAKNELINSLAAVRHLIDAKSLDDLQSAPYGLADLLCRFTHIGYHLGQITKIREVAEQCSQR